MLPLTAVVVARFEQEVYRVSRGAGSVTVCLTKDLATAKETTVGFMTISITAQSESQWPSINVSIIMHKYKIGQHL